MASSPLVNLPSELLEHLLTFFDLPSLLALSATSRAFRTVVTSSSLPSYALHRLNYSPATLRHLHDYRHLSWAQRALWADGVRQRWDDWNFGGEALGGLGREWERCMPVLKLWDAEEDIGGVLIARGRGLELWHAADLSGRMEHIPVVVQNFEEAPPLYDRRRSGRARSDGRGALDDITAIAEGTRAGEMIISRVSGLVQRLRIADYGGRGRPMVLVESARYSTFPSSRQIHPRPGSTTVQALHSSSNLLVAASTTRLRPPHPQPQVELHTDSLAHSLAQRAAPKQHHISLHSIVAPWQPPVILPFSTKPWSVLLSPSSSSSRPSWLAVGHSGTAPLTLFHLDSTGSPLPAFVHLACSAKPTSVYALTTPSPLCSPFLHPTQTLVAAFFDSTTRIYDLRLPPPSITSTPSSWADDDRGGKTGTGNEILRLSDPWSDDPCYSVAVGGAMGARVAVGSARNGAVRLFDVRQPSQPVSGGGGRGITAFAPGKDRSPVYGLAMEGSRVWGVTERRGFVFEFEGGRGGAGRRGDSVAFVKHQGEGEGQLRRT
ncbi:hypothetical protein JCM1841_000028 [Sporobolomyces salmonicolor]